MEYYDYRDWMAWPEDDIREYAREIAFDHSLSGEETAHLESQMAQHAGYWPITKKRIGPWKMDADSEALYRSLGNNDEEVLSQNRRMNRFSKEQRFQVEGEWATLGSGLTRRSTRKITWASRAWRKEDKRAKRHRADQPFISINLEMRALADEALWAANCYPRDYGVWLVRHGNDAPHEGLIWYSNELLRAYDNARRQEAQGNHDAAIWHAFRTGVLCTELAMRLAHGPTFDKYQAVNSAQRDAARSRKIIPDGARREAYWRYRNEGHKRTEAGRLAGEELGISASSIRNAFPDGRYPPD